jgi:hypothetical protein
MKLRIKPKNTNEIIAQENKEEKSKNKNNCINKLSQFNDVRIYFLNFIHYLYRLLIRQIKMVALLIHFGTK